MTTSSSLQQLFNQLAKEITDPENLIEQGCNDLAVLHSSQIHGIEQFGLIWRMLAINHVIPFEYRHYEIAKMAKFYRLEYNI